MFNAMRRQLVIGLILLMCGHVSAWAASAQEINARANTALQELYAHAPQARELYAQAAGVLIFPKVLKAGFGIGGEYGEGVLRVNGRNTAYYSVAGASVGFQFGAQVKRQVIMFMTPGALQAFRNSQGWEAGVDGSVAVVTLGVGETLDTNTLQQPIIGFVFSNKGLMYNLTLEGSKISRIQR